MMHLFRVFEIALAINRELPFRGIDGGVHPNTSEEIIEFFVLRLGVAHPVGGDDRKRHRLCETKEDLIAGLLIPPPMPLQLHIESSRKKIGKAMEDLLKRHLRILFEKGGDDGSLVSSGQTE